MKRFIILSCLVSACGSPFDGQWTTTVDPSGLSETYASSIIFFPNGGIDYLTTAKMPADATFMAGCESTIGMVGTYEEEGRTSIVLRPTSGTQRVEKCADANNNLSSQPFSEQQLTPQTYTYKIENNTLTLTQAELQSTVTLTRK